MRSLLSRKTAHWFTNMASSCSTGELTRHESRIVIGELLKDKQLNFVACGLQSAYVSENAPEAFVALMAKHYHRLKPVKDYQEIDDVLFKVFAQPAG